MTGPISSPLRALAVLAVLLLAAACGPAAPAMPTPPGEASPTGPTGYPGWPPLDQPGELLPIPVTSELAVGRNRFLLNLVDEQNEPLAAPDRTASLSFYDLAADPANPTATVQGTYLPTIPQLPGLYRAMVDFERAGAWGIEVETTEPDGSKRTGRMVFSVRATSSTPALGSAAIASTTPTADTPEEIAQISTDAQPEPAFYRLSVDEALAQGEPFLLFFGTPAFCKTATCGPAMDLVKQVAADFKGEVAVIHVEPYQLQPVGGHLQPVLREGQLVPVESVVEWGLLTEPMLFAVDGDGIVRAKLEGVASGDELRAAMEAIRP
jgi:hypothetical protein